MKHLGFQYGPARWQEFAYMDMRDAMAHAERRLLDMGCPDPRTYIENAALMLMGEPWGEGTDDANGG